MVGERGFEPPTPWSRNGHRNTILLIRLAWFCVLGHGFTRFSAVIGPKLDSSFFAVQPSIWLSMSVMGILRQHTTWAVRPCFAAATIAQIRVPNRFPE